MQNCRFYSFASISTKFRKTPIPLLISQSENIFKLFFSMYIQFWSITNKIRGSLIKSVEKWKRYKNLSTNAEVQFFKKCQIVSKLIKLKILVPDRTHFFDRSRSWTSAKFLMFGRNVAKLFFFNLNFRWFWL